MKKNYDETNTDSNKKCLMIASGPTNLVDQLTSIGNNNNNNNHNTNNKIIIITLIIITLIIIITIIIIIIIIIIIACWKNIEIRSENFLL